MPAQAPSGRRVGGGFGSSVPTGRLVQGSEQGYARQRARVPVSSSRGPRYAASTAASSRRRVARSRSVEARPSSRHSAGRGSHAGYSSLYARPSRNGQRSRSVEPARRSTRAAARPGAQRRSATTSAQRGGAGRSTSVRDEGGRPHQRQDRQVKLHPRASARAAPPSHESSGRRASRGVKRQTARHAPPPQATTSSDEGPVLRMYADGHVPTSRHAFSTGLASQLATPAPAAQQNRALLSPSLASIAQRLEAWSSLNKGAQADHGERQVQAPASSAVMDEVARALVHTASEMVAERGRPRSGGTGERGRVDPGTAAASVMQSLPPASQVRDPVTPVHRGSPAPPPGSPGQAALAAHNKLGEAISLHKQRAQDPLAEALPSALVGAPVIDAALDALVQRVQGEIATLSAVVEGRPTPPGTVLAPAPKAHSEERSSPVPPDVTLPTSSQGQDHPLPSRSRQLPAGHSPAPPKAALSPTSITPSGVAAGSAAEVLHRVESRISEGLKRARSSGRDAKRPSPAQGGSRPSSAAKQPALFAPKDNLAQGSDAPLSHDAVLQHPRLAKYMQASGHSVPRQPSSPRPSPSSSKAAAPVQAQAKASSQSAQKKDVGTAAVPPQADERAGGKPHSPAEPSSASGTAAPAAAAPASKAPAAALQAKKSRSPAKTRSPSVQADKEAQKAVPAEGHAAPRTPAKAATRKAPAEPSYTGVDASAVRRAVQAGASKAAVSQSPTSPMSPGPRSRPPRVGSDPTQGSVALFRRRYGAATAVNVTGASLAQKEAAEEAARAAQWQAEQDAAALQDKLERQARRAAARKRASLLRASAPAAQAPVGLAFESKVEAELVQGRRAETKADAPDPPSPQASAGHTVQGRSRTSGVEVCLENTGRGGMEAAAAKPRAPPPTVPASAVFGGGRYDTYKTRRHMPAGSSQVVNKAALASAAAALRTPGAKQAQASSGMMVVDADGNLGWSTAALRRRETLGMGRASRPGGAPVGPRQTQASRSGQATGRLVRSGRKASRASGTQGTTRARAASVDSGRSRRALSTGAARQAVHGSDGAPRYSRGPVRSRSAPRVTARSMSHRASAGGGMQSPILRAIGTPPPREVARTEQKPVSPEDRRALGIPQGLPDSAARRSARAVVKHVFRKAPADGLEVAQDAGILPMPTLAFGGPGQAAQRHTEAHTVRGAGGHVLFTSSLDASQNTPHPAREAAALKEMALSGRHVGQLGRSTSSRVEAAADEVVQAPRAVVGFGTSSRATTPADVYGVPPLSPHAALSGLPHARRPRLAGMQSPRHIAQAELASLRAPPPHGGSRRPRRVRGTTRSS